MSHDIFVSYSFARDLEFANNLKTFFPSGGGRCDGTLRFVEEDVSAAGDQAIDREINRVMNGCSAALFLAGDEVHNSPWIEREAELAISKALPVIAVRRPDSTGALPLPLRGRVPLVAWDHDAICGALKSALP